MKKLFLKFATLCAAFSLLAPFSAARALSISPPYVDYRLNPGDTSLDKLRVYNEEKVPMTFHIEMMNFTHSAEENGSPNFYPATEKRDGTELATWITSTETNKTYTLQPNEQTNIPFTITVPADAQPGAHYGAILLASGGATPKDKVVSVNSKIGELVFISVSGAADERGRIAEFGFQEPKSWHNYRPVDFFLRFENDGNTNIRPTGTLVIKNWYGRQVADLKVNEQLGSVLPKSLRRFEFGWGKKNSDSTDFFSELKKEASNFAFGKYTATLLLHYGAKNQILSEERDFYVWPWRILVVGGDTLIVFVVLISLLKKSYDKRLIDRYQRKR